MGPGPSWGELHVVSGQSAKRGVTDPDARMLLLFPLLGDANTPKEANQRLAVALASQLEKG